MTAIVSDALDTLLADPDAIKVWRLELYPYDLSAEAEITLRVASQESATKPTDSPASVEFDARLLVAVNFQADAFVPGTVGPWALSAGDVSGGLIKLGNDHGDWDPYLDETAYAWDGRKAVLRLGGHSPQLGRWLNYNEEATRTYIIDGVSQAGEPEIEVRLRDEDDQFSDDIQVRNFLATGWMLKGDGSSGLVSFGDISKLRETNELSFFIRHFHKSTGAVQHLIGWTNTPFKVAIDASDQLFLKWLKSTATVTKTHDTAALTDGDPYVLEGSISDTEVKLRVIDEATRTVVEKTFSGSGFTGRDAHGAGDVYRYFKSFGATDYCPGMIDEVRLWGRVLTDDEFEQMRYRALTVAEKADADLLQVCELDDGEGSTTVDDGAATAPADGTISGTCTWYESLLGATDGGGNPMPICFGEVYGASPVLVSPATHIYMMASHLISGVGSVFEGGTKAHALDTAYTDVFAFLAGATTAGEYDTLKKSWGSFFRLGSRPDKPVTMGILGYATGGYVDTASEIAQVVMTDFGHRPLEATDLDASWLTLTSANGSAIGLYIREQRSRLDVLNEILGTVGAYTYRKRLTNKQAVKRFEGVSGTSVLTVTEEDVIGNPVDIRPEKAAQKIEVEYRRCWTVLSTDQLLPPATKSDWFRWVFHQTPARWAPAYSASAKRDHKLATPIRFPSLFVSQSAALTEAARRIALYGVQRRPRNVTINEKGFQLDRGDVITLSYRDLDSDLREQNRYGMGSGTDVMVLGIRELAYGESNDEPHGTAELVVWGGG